jgi:hypothetical protein
LPLSIPAFVQYQEPMFPLRGLWNRAPVEGDQFVNAEVDWIATTNNVSAVQFSLSGNSPVAISQIAALSIDNGRCGVDVDFIFPDSGFVLTVPAHNQGLFPVFTNALMFYASAPGCAAGDITIIQILNSLPPPVPIPPTEQQNTASVTGIATSAGTTQIVPLGVNGTLNSLSINCVGTSGGTAGSYNVVIRDGTGKNIWAVTVAPPASATINPTFNIPGLNVRFVNGLVCVVNFVSNAPTGGVIVNAYYSSP